MSELAIANILVQQWETPLKEKEAFENGTIFPCLNMPFFIEEQMPKSEAMPKSEQDILLEKICQVSFALTDISLYLDTHPHEKEALSFRESLRLKRKELLQSFAEKYYPLTPDCEGDCCEFIIPWDIQ